MTNHLSEKLTDTSGQLSSRQRDTARATLRERLKAELKTPYRGLRQFVYLSVGASGFIGALIFLAQLLAGRNIESALPNFAIQTGIVALVVGLFYLEKRASRH